MTDHIPEPEVETQRITKADDFKYVPADMVRIAMSDHGMKMQFAAEDAPNELTALVQVHLSHDLARKLQKTLASALNDYDQQKK